MHPAPPAIESAIAAPEKSLNPSRTLRWVFMLVLLTTVARRVEPPLRAEPEEVLERADRVNVILRVEHPRALAADGERVDEPEHRAAVVAAPRGREEGDDAEPEEARAE